MPQCAAAVLPPKGPALSHSLLRAPAISISEPGTAHTPPIAAKLFVCAAAASLAPVRLTVSAALA